MEARQSHPEDEDGEETALLLRRPPGHDLAIDQQPTHFDEGHAGPRQQYAYIAAQGSSRIHAGNSHVEHQHNYYGPEATPEKPEKKIMSLKTALAFPEMSLRAANIATAQAQTCDWIFETPEYKRWLDPASRPAHHGILWIKGKPGAGKSTIMKHIMRTSQIKRNTGKSVSFFFNARGRGLARSTEGLYRALLHPIVDGVSSLQAMVEPELRPILKDHGWPLELLKDLFREAVLKYQYDGSLTCYVDALDECDEPEIRNMLELFEDLGDMAMSEDLPFSVCFTSRHYPKITITHVEEIVIDDLGGHQRDISKYVQRRLNVGVSKALKEDFATEIRRKSSGVFLWVVLVVGVLNKTKDHGRIDLLRTRLREIPEDLHALFDDILGRDKLDANFLPIIQWSLYAARPLKAAELYFAVMASTESLTATTIQWDTELVDERVLRDFVTASSKGFLETVPNNWDSDNSAVRLSVQFIHESAREFFKNYGLQRLDKNLGNAVAEATEAVRHRLARGCLSYMQLSLAQHLSSAVSRDSGASSSGSVLNAESLDTNPFLEYVLADGLCHPVMPRSFSTYRKDLCNDRFRSDDEDEVVPRELHSLMVSAMKSLIRCAPAISPGAHESTKSHDAHAARKTWDEYHVARLEIICVLLAAVHAERPRNCRCADSARILIHHGTQRNIWGKEACQPNERLSAAMETADALVTLVAVKATASSETFTDMQTAALYKSMRRSTAGIRWVTEMLYQTRMFASMDFFTMEFEHRIELARRHYQMSGDGDLFFHLLELRDTLPRQYWVDWDGRRERRPKFSDSAIFLTPF
jgi:hypothetical protein